MATLNQEMVEHYKEQARLAANARGLELADVEVFLTDEGKVKVVSHYAPSSIERVRRVTGYFCKLNNCNSAKMSEISQRVYHS